MARCKRPHGLVERIFIRVPRILSRSVEEMRRVNLASTDADSLAAPRTRALACIAPSLIQAASYEFTASAIPEDRARELYMPASYEPPDVKSSLTSKEIRQRYQDASLLIFKEHQLQQSRRRKESERENINYLSFGINRRTMTYSNNGNEAIVVHRTISKAAVQANRNSRFSFHMFRINQKPRESCTIS